VDLEAELARADVDAGLLVPDADLAEEAGQERAVDLLGSRRLVGGREAELAHGAHQLLVDVLPLAHPPRRDEVVAARPLELRATAAAAGLLVERPQLQVAEEVADLVAELLVRLVGLLLGRQRPLARILEAERRRDDQHLAERALALAAQHHAAQPRVDG
jgi:hypothetical protein